MLTAISLRSTGNSSGVTRAAGQSGFLSAKDIRHRLIMGLAGRAAEEVILGEPSSGAGGAVDSDLAVATGLVQLVGSGDSVSVALARG